MCVYPCVPRRLNSIQFAERRELERAETSGGIPARLGRKTIGSVGTGIRATRCYVGEQVAIGVECRVGPTDGWLAGRDEEVIEKGEARGNDRSGAGGTAN